MRNRVLTIQALKRFFGSFIQNSAPIITCHGFLGEYSLTCIVDSNNSSVMSERDGFVPKTMTIDPDRLQNIQDGTDTHYATTIEKCKKLAANMQEKMFDEWDGK